MSGLRVFLFISVLRSGRYHRPYTPGRQTFHAHRARVVRARQGPTHWLRGARGSLARPSTSRHTHTLITATSFPLAQDGYGNRLTLILTLTLTRISAVSFAFAAARLVRT